MTGYRVQVVGLNELRRALRAADPAFAKEIGAANNKAAQVVADEAYRRAPAGPHQGGGRVVPIRGSIRALRGQRSAAVAMGGARSPQAAPTEFGGTLRRYHSQARTTVKQRAFLYPAITATRDEVVRVYTYALNGVVEKLKGA